MSYSFGQMPSMATNLFSAYASVAASMMLFRSVANEVIPQPLKTFLYTSFEHFFKHVFGRFFRKLSTQMTMVIDEKVGYTPNQIYDAADIYLRTKINPNSERLKANKTHKQNSITLSMEKGEEVIDFFRDFQVTWVFVLVEPDGDSKSHGSTKRYFELKFDKLRRETIVNYYLPFVLAKAKEMKDNERAVKLYTKDCPCDSDDDDDGGNRGGIWGCVNLDHPVTFEKLAMDPNLKKFIIEDLDRFVRRKEYYKKVGKAWKRGYLLYGPPGTGKSSLIAAMANYLKFDVYDLELTRIYDNSDLRRTLLCTNNRSILVIEDIDCNSQTLNREDDSDRAYEDPKKLTLSGLLNFIDGLWSTCGDERIVIFTTNHKDKLDPALLRPGRMDMHIHMGYCTPEGFDVLLNNYLGINDHPRLCLQIKEMIREVDVSPAEIAERLMRSEDVDLALEGVLGLLKQKKVEKSTGLNASSNVKEKETDVVQIHETDSKNSFGKIVGNLAKFRWQTNKSKNKGC